MKTAEEFYREKYKESKLGLVKDFSLSQISINGETAMRWAKEYSDYVLSTKGAELDETATLEEILLNKAKELGVAVDFSNKSYDGDLDPPLDMIGFVEFICNTDNLSVPNKEVTDKSGEMQVTDEEIKTLAYSEVKAKMGLPDYLPDTGMGHQMGVTFRLGVECFMAGAKIAVSKDKKDLSGMKGKELLVKFSEWIRTFEMLDKQNGYWVLESQISDDKLVKAFLDDTKVAVSKEPELLDEDITPDDILFGHPDKGIESCWVDSSDMRFIKNYLPSIRKAMEEYHLLKTQLSPDKTEEEAVRFAEFIKFNYEPCDNGMWVCNKDTITIYTTKELYNIFKTSVEQNKP